MDFKFFLLFLSTLFFFVLFCISLETNVQYKLLCFPTQFFNQESVMLLLALAVSGLNRLNDLFTA